MNASTAAEKFDPKELRAIAAAMEEYERRCQSITSLLGDKRRLTPLERAQIEVLYRGLKEDIRRAAKHGTLSGEQRELTRAEECFFRPAISRAATDLRPATNTNPIASRWFGAISDARSEFSYWLRNLKQSLGE